MTKYPLRVSSRLDKVVIAEDLDVAIRFILNYLNLVVKEFLSLTKEDKRFSFPGFISDDQLKTLYKNAVANILVSHEEGFGFSYFEAASQKTPSILSDIEIFHETAEKTAIFVDQNNPATVAQAIKKISEDKTLRKNLGQKAFERLRSLPDSTAAWKLLLDSLQTQQ